MIVEIERLIKVGLEAAGVPADQVYAAGGGEDDVPSVMAYDIIVFCDPETVSVERIDTEGDSTVVLSELPASASMDAAKVAVLDIVTRRIGAAMEDEALHPRLSRAY